jgi:hypothetical protein
LPFQRGKGFFVRGGMGGYRSMASWRRRRGRKPKITVAASAYHEEWKLWPFGSAAKQLSIALGESASNAIGTKGMMRGATGDESFSTGGDCSVESSLGFGSA